MEIFSLHRTRGKYFLFDAENVSRFYERQGGCGISALHIFFFNFSKNIFEKNPFLL